VFAQQRGPRYGPAAIVAGGCATASAANQASGPALLDRGFARQDVVRIMGGNIQRLLAATLA
jgi:hypothetical protein